ncbi:MAG: glycosyltransferase, partial [Gemmatimonadetes bacterium]|nr:glycosyltransferase [Gemmatimonadota bacterium]
MPKICLSMIVKNEERVIRRCLESVLPYIDAWAIVDTGSTDRTMEIIREVMADVDGVLLEREWVDNFGVSRTQALEAARSSGCDYALVQDADDVFSAPEGFVWPEDMGDGGMLPHFLGEMEYWRTQLLKLERAWEYRGVVHEYPVIPGEHERLVRVVGPSVTITREGARSTFSVEEKYGHDAKLLRQALEENPGDTRSAFYLAQSLRDAGRYEEAQVAYRRRARMGGFAEEVWVSMFQVALIEQHLDRLDWELVAELFVQAYEFRPSRVEPLL